MKTKIKITIGNLVKLLLRVPNQNREVEIELDNDILKRGK